MTYKTHLDFDEYKAKIIGKLPDTKLWSFVHENGDAEEENPTPYEHTHVFIWTNKPIDTTSSRYFEIGEIHPNIQIQRSIQWAITFVRSTIWARRRRRTGRTIFLSLYFYSRKV